MKDWVSMRANHSFRIKCAGGAAAQVLALMDGVYLSQKTGRDFIFDYYPFGTGTHWAFEIGALLKGEELGDVSRLSRGHIDSTPELPFGKIVESHPINNGMLNIEGLYSIIRRFKLDKFLLSLRGELSINASSKRLDKITLRTHTISGGFLPILDKDVFDSLHNRFLSAGFRSPFNLAGEPESEFEVVIHYRLGDKRAKYSHPGVVGDDGILDPKVVFDLLSGLNKLNSKILVLSDEPYVAQQLLAEAGVFASTANEKGTIWDDIYLMAISNLFIGTWSQVSQLASVCVLHGGGQAYLPSHGKGRNSLHWTIDGLEFYQPKFLDSSHPVYLKK
jgi:hypothetical protein